MLFNGAAILRQDGKEGAAGGDTVLMVNGAEGASVGACTSPKLPFRPTALLICEVEKGGVRAFEEVRHDRYGCLSGR